MQEILTYLPWLLCLLVLLFAAGLLWSKSKDQKALQEQHEEQLFAFRRQHTEATLALQQEHQAILRRRDREAEKQQERASFPLALTLLPVLDALEQALQSTQFPQTTTQDIAQGLELLQHTFLQALEQHKITPICPQLGEDFDPELHEAIGILETSEIPTGKIAQCLRTGWKHPAGLLRPATVQTAQYIQKNEVIERAPAPPNEASASKQAP